MWFAPVSIKWCEASCMRFNENYVFFCLFRFHYCQECLFYFRIFWFIVNKYGISTSAQSFSLEGTGHIRHIRWRVMQKKCFHNTFATYLCIDTSAKKKTLMRVSKCLHDIQVFFFPNSGVFMTSIYCDTFRTIRGVMETQRDLSLRTRHQIRQHFVDKQLIDTCLSKATRGWMQRCPLAASGSSDAPSPGSSLAAS